MTALEKWQKPWENDIYDLPLSKKGNSLNYVYYDDVVKKMVFDFVSKKQSFPSTWHAIIRRIVTWKSSDLSNTDPFHDFNEDSERIYNGGEIKEHKTKKVAYVEIPAVFKAARKEWNMQDLEVTKAGYNDLFRDFLLLRLSLPDKTSRKEDFKVGEIIVLAFKSPKSLTGPMFASFPKDEPLFVAEGSGFDWEEKTLKDTKAGKAKPKEKKKC